MLSICRRRIFFVLLLFSCLILMLGLRLFSIQILKSADLSRQAVRQRAQSIVLFDGRGDIQDRRRQSLLDGRREMGLVAFPVLYRGEEEKIRQYLSGLLALDKITAPAPDRLPFWASPLIAGPLPPELADLPGLIPAPRTRRFGPDALASHLVGYIRESEGIGVSGIERAFDDELSKGGETRLAALVDGRGRLIPGLGYRIQQKGGRSLNVVLSVDRKLQREVERIMDLYLRQGAVVVMDPFNGDILALASRPDFKAGDLAQALAGEQDSLLNRALWDYQPGSVFKTVTAAAALEEELAGLFDTFNCFGGVYVDGLFFPCSNLHSKQQITLVEAFAYSCNSVFIELALKLGPEKLDGYARRFGFAEPVGLPVGERPGRLPPLADISRPRALANLALGQGEMLATPVQVAAMISPFANGGRLIEPRLVLGLTDYYGREQKNFLPKRGNVVLSPAVLHKMNYLLQAVTMQGTGRAAGLSGSATAGMKTGTAESGRLKDNRPVYNYWAAGFYPLEKTRYVIVVFADDLKRGSAAKVFGEIINNILHKN